MPIYQAKNIYTLPSQRELFDLFFSKGLKSITLCAIIATTFREQKFESIEKIEEALCTSLPNDVNNKVYSTFYNALVHSAHFSREVS